MDSTALGPFIPQKKYQPHTKSDYRRYVDEITLDPSIKFTLQNPNQGGIPLRDALTSRFMRLVGRDDLMFVQRGPSISIRLEWQGYQSWSRQIPTRDFRNPPGPITRAKLAKNVAKSVDRFINEHKDLQLERGADPKWRVGPGYIDIDNLILVELQHVSMGSWQAHLRLAHPIHPMTS
ncbi:hypothetical protein BD410DRAFT_720956 [Rickenella mellea]|uniref:Uncharacterized protein n=1 Tax=Rickenella mellea TaxID=50990 RepID=A0A4Y7Q8C3_9AGAM|nr:hypothetical protein BD410DRAFT_720956 [Rickenella mellea]